MKRSLFSPDHALWGLGFRPFFLLGATAALILIAIWLSLFLGGLNMSPFMMPLTWHAHEMIYGFGCAIVVGFLLTAVQNWTGRRGKHGVALQLLAVVWLAARLWPFAGRAPSIAYMLVDLGFLLLAMVYLWPYLTAAGQRHHLTVYLALGMLLLGDGLVHLDLLGYAPGQARRGLLLGVDTLVALIVLIGGRVIPFFTRNALRGAAPRSNRWIELGSHLSVFAFIFAELAAERAVATAVIAVLAALFNMARWLMWRPLNARRIPILWILYIAYAWLIVGFLLKALVPFDLLPSGVATHAFTVGGIGVAIVGMISRVSLGHTARPIKASPFMVAAYALINAAALVRVFGPVVMPNLYTWAIATSGSLWVAAFGVFLFQYSRVLLAPRLDGKVG